MPINFLRFIRLRVKRLLLIAISLSLIGVAITRIDMTDLGQKLARFPPSALGVVFVLLMLNLGAVWLRFWRMLAHFGIRLGAGSTWRAFLQGQLAGLFVIQLVGQMAGRGIALARHGVTPSTLAALSVYERGTLFALSATLALVGVTHLLSLEVLEAFLSRLHFGLVAMTLLIATLLAALLGASRHEAILFARMRSGRVAGKLFSAIALTLLGQSLMLAAYVVAALAVRPDTEVTDVLAAAAVVSFAASLPISVNGWGVREIAAIALLGLLGYSSAEALTVSILIGVCATLVTLAPMPLLLRRTLVVTRDDLIKTPLPDAVRDFDRLAAWVLGGLAAFFILFQFHAKFPFGETNVNLADPLALLGLGTLLVGAILQRRAPHWRLRGVNIWVAAASLVLVLAFVIGTYRIGVTTWALSNRMLGWFILLGYAALGAWFVQMSGHHGLRRLVDYLTACATAIVLTQIVLRMLAGFGSQPFVLTQYFEGYAGNSNAFAFQLLACMAGLMAWSPQRARHGRTFWHDIAFGVLLAGLWLTNSRAGLGTGALMLLFAWWLRLSERRSLLHGTAFATLLLACIYMVANVATGGTGSADGAFVFERSYDYQRWDSIREGLRMWSDAPLFGAGLGVFIHESERLFVRPMLIHSTPVWWLAEFGLVGFLLFCSGLFGLLVWGLRHARKQKLASARLVIMLVLIFAIFGLVHDIFAQRIFWFLLGAGLAVPAVTGAVSVGHEMRTSQHIPGEALSK